MIWREILPLLSLQHMGLLVLGPTEFRCLRKGRGSERESRCYQYKSSIKIKVTQTHISVVFGRGSKRRGGVGWGGGLGMVRQVHDTLKTFLNLKSEKDALWRSHAGDEMKKGYLLFAHRLLI